MPGHSVSKKMMYQLKQRFYCRNQPALHLKVQAFLSNSPTCIRSKPIAKQQLRPPLLKIYDPSNGPEDLLEIGLVGPLPTSNRYTYILTAVDKISKLMFATPLRRFDAQSVVKGVMLIFTRHAYVATTIMTDKGTAFTAEAVKWTMESAGNSLKHATVKHAQTIDMIEHTHQKLETLLKTNICADQPQWDQNVNIAGNGPKHHLPRFPEVCTDRNFRRTTIKSQICKSASHKQPSNSHLEYARWDQETIETVCVHSLITAYHKYKTQYDRKSCAHPIEINKFMFVLNPQYEEQSSRQNFKSL